MATRPQFMNPFAQRRSPINKASQNIADLLTQVYQVNRQQAGQERLIDALQQGDRQAALEAAPQAGQDPLRVQQYFSQQQAQEQEQQSQQQSLALNQSRIKAFNKQLQQLNQAAKERGVDERLLYSNLPLSPRQSPNQIVSQAQDIIGETRGLIQAADEAQTDEEQQALKQKVIERRLPRLPERQQEQVNLLIEADEYDKALNVVSKTLGGSEDGRSLHDLLPKLNNLPDEQKLSKEEFIETFQPEYPDVQSWDNAYMLYESNFEEQFGEEELEDRADFLQYVNSSVSSYEDPSIWTPDEWANHIINSAVELYGDQTAGKKGMIEDILERKGVQNASERLESMGITQSDNNSGPAPKLEDELAPFELKWLSQ